ncbi:hypothetical protein [Burkholderia sp. Ax-1719]|uniref:hypothetical protein n=1 Tax=Burkholderia sp. Ax-1719 TaxID=2608334 RepID=UPI0014209DDA|nr:hypothetical protein [Burkholderia sp. Ax-1719]NIE63223.1 hypothetical protein [Burkholderia sp. Ax-1719]
MSEFKPDERQQRLIEQALRSHREAQAHGSYAPEWLVEKWSNEVGVDTPKKNLKTDAEVNPKNNGDAQDSGRK